MTQPLPYEPVTAGFVGLAQVPLPVFHIAPYPSVLGENFPVCVTLANGQRIIVRALSEERKAARAFNRRVKKAVDANRRPWFRGVE